jgi:lysophospholipase L1-like esterase
MIFLTRKKVTFLCASACCLFMLMTGMAHASGVCVADFGPDADVDGSDLAVFSADFGRTDCSAGSPCRGDFNGDGNVNDADLEAFSVEFGRSYCALPSENLALLAAVTASSEEGAEVAPQMAVDGNGSTRWSSLYSDPQWIYVDLGTICFINHVVLDWESAYGKAYYIQVSNDATTWTTVFSESNGDGGTDDIVFPLVLARYVRVYGTQRGTSYGYSLWEFQVFGNPCIPPDVKIDRPQSYALQISPDLVLRAAACLENPANGVRFIIDGGTGSSRQVDLFNEPYEQTFLNLSASEHVVDVQIIDASGNNVTGTNTHDRSIQVGIGNYLVATGDSITYGFGGDFHTSADGRNTGPGFEPLLNNLLTLDLGVPHTVENEGVPGEISAYGVSEIDAVLDRYPNAQLILVQWGTNDADAYDDVPSGLGLNPGDDGYAGSFKDHLKQIIIAVNNAGKAVCLAKLPIVLGEDVTGPRYDDPADPPLNSRGYKILQYNSVIDELYRDADNNIAVIPPNFWALFNEDVSGGKRYDSEYSDNFHPNGTGYASMANEWALMLEPYYRP